MGPATGAVRHCGDTGCAGAPGLAVLTALEFWAAVSLTTVVVPVLVVIALVKAWLILDYFMHISRLWSAEE